MSTKEIKGAQIWNDKIKLSLLTTGMITYLENVMIFTKRSSGFMKIQKSIVILYNSSKWLESEMKIVSFKII